MVIKLSTYWDSILFEQFRIDKNQQLQTLIRIFNFLAITMFQLPTWVANNNFTNYSKKVTLSTLRHGKKERSLLCP